MNDTLTTISHFSPTHSEIPHIESSVNLWITYAEDAAKKEPPHR